MLTFACPAASRTSASVRPPASAWLINACRPWWIVRLSSRVSSSDLQAVRNRLRSVWREHRIAPRPGRGQTRNQSSEPALPEIRLVFQAAISASVPGSHHNGTIRPLPLLTAPVRIRRWGREPSTRTSDSRSPAISLARRPQQAARRNSTSGARSAVATPLVRDEGAAAVRDAAQSIRGASAGLGCSGAARRWRAALDGRRPVEIPLGQPGTDAVKSHATHDASPRPRVGVVHDHGPKREQNHLPRWRHGRLPQLSSV